MSNFEDSFTPALAVVLSALEELSCSSLDRFDDQKLLDTQSELAEARRRLDATAARVAGIVDHRSRPELGSTGLAQRTGYRTPEKLIQHLTGSTARDASTLVTVGVIMREAVVVGDQPSWLRAVGAAVAAGSLSVAAAEAIRNGLGKPSEHVTVDQLRDAVDSLLLEAIVLDADRLFQHARDLRDALDAEGVADRERRIHDQRGVRRARRPDGSLRITIDTDLESGAYLDDLLDKMISPRRGGPRFITEDDRLREQAIIDDPRTVPQLLHDGLFGVVRIGVNADNSESRAIVGSRQPSVRVLVRGDSIVSGTDFGRIEITGMPGSGETAAVTAVSIETVERIACAEGTITVGFDSDGQVLNLGREQRLFTAAQRIALAARDGGCRWTDCYRPPSWTEAHHSQHWHADSGRTDVADGILLCRHHHMLLHNNHWDITRDGADYWLTPPVDVEPTQSPRLLPTKSAALRDLLGAVAGTRRAD